MIVNRSSASVLALPAEDLACFAVAVHPGFELARHHRVLIEKLEALERGEIPRLVVALPPRHGKSLLGSQLLPSWYLGRHPERSVICATYGQDLSDDFGRRTRNLLADPLFRAIFPGCRLSGDSSSLRRFDTLAGGSYYAVGRGGPMTGRGCDLLVCDDLLKDREEAYSETTRRNLHDWFATVALTRLAPGAAVLIIATRWHEDDLTGWLLREHAADGWEVLNLPALAELRDPLGRSEGDALWPQRYPVEALNSIRRQMGGAAFAALYQQRPAAAEGLVFKRQWLRYFREQPRFTRIIHSWDTAFKTGSENDFSVGTVWGVANGGYYLVWLWRGKVDFPELKRRLVLLATEYEPGTVLVEDKASGQSLIQELKYDTRLPIIPIKADRDKRARAEAITPMFEAGKVHLPEGAPWLTDFVDELAAFPTGVHDDMVDSTTQALNYLRPQVENTVTISYVQL